MRRSNSSGFAGRRTIRVCGAALALALAGLTGCDNKFDEFRAAASPQLEAGVNAVLDGLVSGIFAAVEPNDTTNSGTGSAQP